MSPRRKKTETVQLPDQLAKNNAILFESVRYGMMAEANKAIKAGADVNARDHKGATPLHIASAMHYEDTVKMLIDLGADVNLKDERDISPLSIAAYNGDNGIAKVLIKAGAKVDEPDCGGVTAIFMTVGSNNLELTKMLIEKGADVKRTILDKLSLLHVAAFSGDVELVKALIDAKAEINTVTEKQMDDYPADFTPLDIARMKGNSAAADILEKNGGLSAKVVKPTKT